MRYVLDQLRYAESLGTGRESKKTRGPLHLPCFSFLMSKIKSPSSTAEGQSRGSCHRHHRGTPGREGHREIRLSINLSHSPFPAKTCHIYMCVQICICACTCADAFARLRLHRIEISSLRSTRGDTQNSFLQECTLCQSRLRRKDG